MAAILKALCIAPKGLFDSFSSRSILIIETTSGVPQGSGKNEF